MTNVDAPTKAQTLALLALSRGELLKLSPMTRKTLLRRRCRAARHTAARLGREAVRDHRRRWRALATSAWIEVAQRELDRVSPARPTTEGARS